MPTRSHPAHAWLALLLFAICAWGIADLSLDSPGELHPIHLGLEITLLLSSLAGGIWLWRSWLSSERKLAAVQKSLEATQRARDDWHQRASRLIDGFHKAMDEQLHDWGLTPAECEVAKYLLKGYSHKEIARFSGRSERTVRQHSVAIYKKSKLSGRAELSAFFLEGLIPEPAAT